MKKLFITLFCAWFLALNVQCAWATTVPVNPFANTLTGVLNANMLGRGFSLADPRVFATLRAVGGVAARWGAAAATTAFIGTGWGALAYGAVVLGMYAGEAAATWLWNYNNPKKVTVTTPVTVPNTPPMVQGGKHLWAAAGGKILAEGTEVNSVASQLISVAYPAGSRLGTCSVQSATQWMCFVYSYDSVADKWNYNAGSFNVVSAETGAPISCGSGRYVDKDGKCVALTPVQTGTNGTPIPLADAVAGIPGLDLTKPLNPAITAAVANKAWIDAAATPGYNGIPYDYTKPITVDDVNNWTAANPGFAPTVDSFTRPNTGTNPFDLPLVGSPAGSVDNTQVNTGTNAAASQPATNLGVDPGIGAPNLESIPTAAQILAPILNLLPDLKNYTVPGGGGECPKFSLSAFNKSYTVDKHCELLEQGRGTIHATMILCFTIMSLFIVLRA
ncbi:hypothetical protein UNDYM_2576 [Undibacterium sp. YM2]|uniref:hypothetical protein n=1 Tax=Undibacterium sp. YM2 TaxID=2058625 RepID=UPI001331CF98|nr:hypothetical protein [Undibacterium sp. YM2]BBB66829.1 hypothetical protein UNDYM_2576 [Undibacterium sp. YM2]